MSHWTDSPAFDPANPFGVDLDGGRPLDQAHRTFTRWLGVSYDLQALDVVLASAAVQRLDGDPVWTLVISGAGNAKTETVAPLAGAGAYVESAITSEGALLSATSQKERSKDATGGLLRKIGESGTLVLKDFTTILSMNRDMRASVLAALREIYDGHWSRNVGTDGGRTLTWDGRLTLIGAATTAYDRHHAVIASMGDRFALVRTDSRTDRRVSGRQALANIGREEQMRAELATATAAVLADVDTTVTVPDWMLGRLLDAADLVTLARTAVDRDYKGEVISAEAPEAPTRFGKMLGQIARGVLAIGGTEAEALNVALRVAHDSIPPLRLALLEALEDSPGQTHLDLTKRLQKPRNTVRRELDALHALELVEYEAEPYVKRDGTEGEKWRYDLAGDVDPSRVRQAAGGADDAGHGPRHLEASTKCPEKSVTPHEHTYMGPVEGLMPPCTSGDVSGQIAGSASGLCPVFGCDAPTRPGAKRCADHITHESESPA